MSSGCLFVFCFFISALFSDTSCAQDSIRAQSSVADAVAFYNKYVGEDSHLYNGSEYVRTDYRIKGDAWFGSDLLQAGSINYDNVLYQKVNLAYDIVHDEIVTNKYQQNFRIKLVSEKVAYFSLPGHFFVRIVQDSMNKQIITTGFYDLLYNGRLKLFAKRIKLIKQKTTVDEADQLWFEERDLYYIEKDNRYYAVQSKALLFDVLRDRKKDVQKYLRKNKIKFRKNPELTILKAVAYYDQLKS
jgi:hypothetical protein